MQEQINGLYSHLFLLLSSFLTSVGLAYLRLNCYQIWQHSCNQNIQKHSPHYEQHLSESRIPCNRLNVAIYGTKTTEANLH